MIQIQPISGTHACEGTDGTRKCRRFADVVLGQTWFCREHAVERLNVDHQAAVEAVHRAARGEP